ncbi:MAG: thioredoxin domain-containing protein [Anaerolineae bacterium]
MPNRLQHETSPYLLQHADNPVNWYPWGEEAFQRAKEEDKPVFLSIGYSACHWCHVMAHESFEDEQVAAFLNERFVSIKVDREERPDLDQIYMAAVQAMTGSGGWPMSVFLTPDGMPFYGGTYFPPVPRHGMPAFTQVLQAVVEAWQTRRSDVMSAGRQIAQAIERWQITDSTGDIADLRRETLDQAFIGLWRSFDREYGGWGSGPKFPSPMVLEFLLRYHTSTGNPLALKMVTQTLEAMARGGVYDQIGGGFHRYSVDGRWQVPHFEKMLYDNAQLARVYLHAWQVTDDKFFRTIAEETLDYVVREMTDPLGGFYSTQDADSEGEEGKFFLWSPDEIEKILGSEADHFMVVYGVTRQGNFEGKNVLEFVGDLDQRPALTDARRTLFQIREHRVHPGYDDKILTSWNGLMLAAFAEAARSLDRSDYHLVAERNAEFLLRELRTENGRLLHTWKANVARQNGFLEDYSYLIEGLLELYQTTFHPSWFLAAQDLTETMLTHFQAADGGFFDTSNDHESLIIRPRDLQDNATPSGNAMAVTALLKLAGLSFDQRYVNISRRALAQIQSAMAQYPLGFGQWLQALAYVLSPPMEIAIIGHPETADTQALLRVVRDGYRPFQVVALAAPSVQLSPVPLLQDRSLVAGRAAAYVCRGFVCQTPVTEPEDLQALLES